MSTEITKEQEEEVLLEIAALENKIEELQEKIDLLEMENNDLQHQIDEWNARD